MTRPVVTVFGSAAPRPEDPAYQTARTLGRALAEAGWTLCNGGYGGTMEAGARGAVEGGGHTIGVTCSAFGRGGPNPYIREEIITSTLFERLERLVTLGRAYIVLPGATGTLAELALVWELLNKGLLDGERPLVLLGRFWDPVVALAGAGAPSAVRPRVAEDVPDVLREVVGGGR